MKYVVTYTKYRAVMRNHKTCYTMWQAMLDAKALRARGWLVWIEQS
jgi:hypothetical protein